MMTGCIFQEIVILNTICDHVTVDIWSLYVVAVRCSCLLTSQNHAGSVFEVAILLPVAVLVRLVTRRRNVIILFQKLYW